MRESSIASSFMYAFKQRFPGAFYYKIPDTAGLGGMRPFDAIAILMGHTFCIEFKVPPNKVTPMQSYQLSIAKHNGATALVVWPLDKTEAILERMETKAKEVSNGRSTIAGDWWDSSR